MASAELSRRVEKIVAYSMLTTTMNIYIHELDDGLGGADNLDGLWGHRGATKTRRQPQTGRTRNSRIPVWKRQPQTAAKRWTSYESAALTAELPARRAESRPFRPTRCRRMVDELPYRPHPRAAGRDGRARLASPSKGHRSFRRTARPQPLPLVHAETDGIRSDCRVHAKGALIPAGGPLLHMPQGDSDGARPPSDRQLKRALIVPMHGTQRVRSSGASVGRRQASTSSAPPQDARIHERAGRGMP